MRKILIIINLIFILPGFSSELPEKPEFNMQRYSEILQTKSSRELKRYLTTTKIDPEDKQNLFTKTFQTGKIELFSLLCKYQILPYMAYEGVLECFIRFIAKKIDFIKIFLKYDPNFAPHFLNKLMQVNKYKNFCYIMNKYKQFISWDELIALFSQSIRYQDQSYTKKILKFPASTDQRFIDMGAIYALFYGNYKICKEFLTQKIVSTEAVLCIYSQLDLRNIEHRKVLNLIDEILYFASEQLQRPTDIPDFKGATASTILMHLGHLIRVKETYYTLKLHFSPIPFNPPYIVSFDKDEHEATIKLDDLFFYRAIDNFSQTYFFEAVSLTPDANLDPYNNSFITVLDQRFPLRLFLELIPVDPLSPPHDKKPIWVLEPDIGDLMKELSFDNSEENSSEGIKLESSAKGQDEPLLPNLEN